MTLRNKDGDTRIVKAEESLNLLGASFEQASRKNVEGLACRAGQVSKLYSETPCRYQERIHHRPLIKNRSGTPRNSISF